MFKGSITALVTPFKNGDIDWPTFDALIEHQIAQGTHALVPCGTTGESPTLTHDEHISILERCAAVVKKRVPVIAGCGSNSTRKAIELTLHAKRVGADAAMIVTPYYNKPTQEGLYAHYRALNDETDFPILIYNVPGRTAVDISNDTVARLAALKHIVGLKDASGDLERVPLLVGMVKPDFCLLTGNDGSAPAFLAQGGHGCISVASNLVPSKSARLQKAWMKGDLAEFSKMRDLLAPLWKALFCETSPAPLKYGMSRMALCTDEVRLPLVAASPGARVLMDEAMSHAGLHPRSELKKTARA